MKVSLSGGWLAATSEACVELFSMLEPDLPPTLIATDGLRCGPAAVSPDGCKLATVVAVPNHVDDEDGRIEIRVAGVTAGDVEWSHLLDPHTDVAMLSFSRTCLDLLWAEIDEDGRLGYKRFRLPSSSAMSSKSLT